MQLHEKQRRSETKACFLPSYFALFHSSALPVSGALDTGFMAMGMMLPGMLSGYVQEWLGYPGFFVWVVIATIPGFVMAYVVKYPREFGKKSK